MKKDRDCCMPFPVYPPYQGMVPPMGMPYQGNMMMPGPSMFPGMINPSSSNVSSNTIEQQLNTLEQRINALDKRITTLENMYNNVSSNKYSSSNYQMM